MQKTNNKHVAKLEKTEDYKPKNDKELLLVRSLLALKTEDEVASFLRDLLTLPEIEEFANRITIAQKLLKEESYLSIARELKVSTTTVTRVAHWLFKGCGGYYKALTK